MRNSLSLSVLSIVLSFFATSSISTPLIEPRQASASPSSSSSSTFPVRDAPGLPDNGLKSSGIHLGFLPNWEQENPQLINQALGDSISVIGDYLNVSPDNYDFRQVDYHLDSVVKIATGRVKAVYAPAVIFSSTLDKWTPQMTDNLANKMREVNRRGVTVWLRFLFEMNGGWMPYGLRPDLYVPLFREVANAVRAQTNNTYMLYAPNVWNGPVDDQSQGYQIYFPGEEYVDIVGLSFYSLGVDKLQNQVADSSLFRSGFTPFYNLFSPSSFSASSNILKLSAAYPIVIAETSAPYYYTIPPGSKYFLQPGDTDISTPLPNLTTYTPSHTSPPQPRTDDELYLKATWLVQLTANTTAARYPNLRAVSWFNYLKKGTEEVLADFRFVGANATVEAWLRQNFGNETAYELGYTGGAPGRSGEIGWLITVAGVLAGCTTLLL
ncbi:uncharacterized protein JCM6883_002525 [Sporobolomyces salmoneus]|uniref:uncharacterized protein n=1 Tax=Sporobolomyces salmoneus TaxID=183962 RepID=UPI00317109AF